jgi:hypothetical protein
LIREDKIVKNPYNIPESFGKAVSKTFKQEESSAMTTAGPLLVFSEDQIKALILAAINIGYNQPHPAKKAAPDAPPKKPYHVRDMRKPPEAV